MNNRQFPSGESTYVDVLARYFVIRMTARLCTRRVLLKNCVHWCMAIDISGCVDPWR